MVKVLQYITTGNFHVKSIPNKEWERYHRYVNILKRLESMYIDDCGLKLKQLTISRKIDRLHCIFYSSPLTVETSDLTFITSVRYVQLLNKTENRKRKWFWKVLRARYYRYDVHRRNLIGETAYFLLIVLHHHHHHLESRASV